MKSIKKFIKTSAKSLLIATLSVATAITPLTVVYATEDNDEVDEGPLFTIQDALHKNDIMFYDKDDELCEPPTIGFGGGGSGPGGSDITASSNIEHVLKFFTGKGLSLAAAAGFVGNMQAESGVRPNIEEGERIVDGSYKLRPNVGFGLIQWSDPGRQRSLQDYATDTNRSIIDIGMQLDFVWIELNAGYKSTLAALSSTPDLTPEKAAVIIHGRTAKIDSLIRQGTDPNVEIFKLAPRPGYEASNDSPGAVLSNRGGFARKIYDQYNGQIDNGGGVGSVGGVDTEPAQLENCASPISNLVDGGPSPSIDGVECTATRPIYGAGGNGRQMKKAQFEKLYGPYQNSRSQQVGINFNGFNVLVHKVVAPCLAAVVEDIKASGSTYKVKVIGGWREAGTGAGAPAKGNGYHDYGVAVDINPDTNPYTRTPRPYDMPSEYIRAFHGRGWSWGGNWKSVKDYMHFEFNGYEVPGSDNITF